MPSPDRSRKLFVRSLLAGTTTLATLMGAQSLALLDSQAVNINTDNEELELAVNTTQDIQVNGNAIADSSLESLESPNEPVIESTQAVILSVEPSITIFRQAGSASNVSNENPTITFDSSTQSLSNNTGAILPPQPVVLQAPDPVVIVEEPVVVMQQQQFQQPQAQQQPAQQQQAQAQQNSKPKKSKSGSSK